MNTDKAYLAIKDDNERSAAVSLIIEIRKMLDKKPTTQFSTTKLCEQFGEKAEIFVKKEFSTELEISFSFNSTDGVTATATPRTEAPKKETQ